MRSPKLRIILALMIALATVLEPSVARAGTLPDTTFLIRGGSHDSSPGGIACPQLKRNVDRTLSFRVLFTQSCIYTTRDAQNQGDWNKLMGISTLLIHRNSIRLGWRWLPAESKMELGFYGYIKGQRIMQPLTKVNLDEWTDVQIRLHKGGLMVQAGTARYERTESLGFSSLFPTPTVILRTAYFGGDETAPHDMTIRVAGITTR